MTTTTPQVKAGIYVRKSSKMSGAKAGRSLAEQERACREAATGSGFEVAEVFSEKEGTGASDRSGGKARPKWHAALRALRDGEIGALFVWEISRADRRGWAALYGQIQPLAEKGRRIVSVVDGADLLDPKQRMVNMIRAEQAHDESELLGERVSRAKASDRAAGRWLGGPLPFGMRLTADRRIEPDPETLPLARAIVDAALAGASLWAMVRTLNGDAETVESLLPFAGTPSPRGGRWNTGTLSAWLRSPSVAGLATARQRTAFSDGGRWQAVGDVLRDETGAALTVGAGILTEEEHETIRGLLAARTTETGRTTIVGAGERRAKPRETTLLAGMVYCPCGAKVAPYGVGSKYLRCSDYARGKGCQIRPSGPREAVEMYVSAEVRRLLGADLRREGPLWQAVRDAYTAAVLDESDSEVADARRKVEEARAALERAEDALADGLLSPAAFERQRDRLGKRLAVAEGDLAKATPAAGIFDPEEPWQAFERGEREASRLLIGLAVWRIYLLPSDRPGTRGVHFEPEDRIRIFFRGEMAHETQWADIADGLPEHGIGPAISGRMRAV
jgi:site-specific DNA recombinase